MSSRFSSRSCAGRVDWRRRRERSGRSCAGRRAGRSAGRSRSLHARQVRMTMVMSGSKHAYRFRKWSSSYYVVSIHELARALHFHDQVLRPGPTTRPSILPSFHPRRVLGAAAAATWPTRPSSPPTDPPAHVASSHMRIPGCSRAPSLARPCLSAGGDRNARMQGEPRTSPPTQHFHALRPERILHGNRGIHRVTRRAAVVVPVVAEEEGAGASRPQGHAS